MAVAAASRHELETQIWASEQEVPIPREERVLTEVDHLLQNRLPNGEYLETTLEDVKQNLTSAVQEAAMPYAVTTTEHEYLERSNKAGTFMWLGRTAVEAAMSGYRFHEHESARARVSVEVDEAKHTEEDLRPGVMKIFISPKMSEHDATREIAKDEHLADDDAVRASWLVTDGKGNISKRVLQSLLVRDIPLNAWVKMLDDPNNIFGKTIQVNNLDSALSVMKAHRKMEIPLGNLQEGPVSVVEAVIEYIDDPEVRKGVQHQLALFRGNQDDMLTKAKNITARWLDFEKELAESLVEEFATPRINEFIDSLKDRWGEDDRRVIDEHTAQKGYKMSRALAVVVERARQNLLWSSAAVLTKNEKVLQQINPKLRQVIYMREVLLQQAQIHGEHIYELESQQNRALAGQNIMVEGGCAGASSGNFLDENTVAQTTFEKQEWYGRYKKQGVCINCDQKTTVGEKNWCKDCISGHCGVKK